MNLITIDIETYFSQEYGFAKHTTEEYVRDDRFEVIGVAVKVNDEDTVWFSGTFEETQTFLYGFHWGESLVLAHNTLFDGAILSWRFGLKPLGWLDTLSMARATDGVEVGNSLGKLAERYGLGVKGDDTRWSKGLRRKDFTPAQLVQYGNYCKNDVDLTYKLFHILKDRFTKKELKLIDLTLQMFTDPVLQLNLPLLEQHLVDVVDRKEKLIAEASSDRDTLLSNQKFAERLRELGVDPPMKISPTTGKPSLALAKSDEGFKALAEHPKEEVQALVAARLGTKSTLEETRTQRFIDIAKRGSLPIPLRYYAAHTGRWGGDDKLNIQNLPSRGKNKNMLKMAICPPPGYVIVDADSSQIEARIVAWLAGQKDLVLAFEEGRDVYKIMAGKIYGKDPDAITDDERFVGKTTILGCLAEGTPVLSDSGWKPIEEITLTDKLWDGEEWVCHQGLVNSGTKETLNLCGVWLTPDHRVWSGTQWLEAQYLAQDNDTLSLALGTAAENLPLQAIYGEYEEGSPVLSFGVSAERMSTQLTGITSKTSEVPDVQVVRVSQVKKNGTGFIHTHYQTTPIEPGFSTVYPLRSLDVIPHLVEFLNTTARVASRSTMNGVRIAHRFLSTRKHLMGGITQSLKWIGSMLTKDMNPATSGLYPAAKTYETNVKSQTLRRKLQTYDLAYAGPRNRYTVLTEQGPMIVHNCGYGMGAMKFQLQLKSFGVELDLAFCQKIIDTYRNEFPHIPKLWAEAGKCVETLAVGELRASPFGVQPQATSFLPGVGFEMPSGIPQMYPGIKKRIVERRAELVYDTRKGPNRIYGGKVVENICQGLARCVIGEQMLKIAKRYKVVFTVHDAVACVARQEEAEEAARYVQECMRWRPTWAQTLPLNCEVKMGDSYGGAKKWKG